VVAAEDEPWRRWIAPWVVQTTDAAGLDLFLPADDAEQQWSWEIAFEGGATDHGTFRRDDLLMLGARDIDGRRIEHRRLSLRRSGPIGYHRMRVSAGLYFEQLGDGRFRSPRDYPAQSVATVGTHDLPTLVGYWEGRDIAVRQRLGIFSTTEAGQAQERRLDDCRRLSEAVASAGFPPPAPADGMQHAPSDLVAAVHRFLTSSSARLFLAQPDDLLGEVDQINVPGTVDTYPNWRHKLSIALEAPAFAEVIARLARICREQARGQRRTPQG
jgi:hypothetical protein